MNLLKSIHKFLFQFETYKKGLIIHLSLLFLYSVVFIGIYFMMRLVDESAEMKAYNQLKLSHKLVLMMFLQLGLLIFYRWKQVIALIKEYFTEKGSPYNLAIFRILFFFNLGGHFLFYTVKFDISWTYLPDTSRVALPFIGWLVHNMPISPDMYYVFSIAAGILCWLICFGLFTRYLAILLLPFAFYVLGVPLFYGKMSHYHILLWGPIILSLAPMADVLSLDAFIKKKRGQQANTDRHMKYFFPFKILWLILAIIYCFAGIIKLWGCGLDWALADSMINQMRWEWVEHYDKVPDFRLDNYPILAKLSGLFVIYFELLYFLLFIKPNGRIWAFIGTFSLHKLCAYFMYIDFADLRLVATSYINWNKFVLFVKNKCKVMPHENPILDNRGLLTILKSEKLLIPFFIGLLFISVNFLFSSFRIHTYPFSSYPTYSAIIKDEIKTIRMEAVTGNGEKVNVKLLGEKSNYRWENIRGYEVRIAETFEKKDSLLLRYKLNEYWQLWCNNVKGLDKVIQVTMYLETTSIVPEKRKEIIHTDTLGVVYPIK